jgi:flagellin-specific chaperone FliS
MTFSLFNANKTNDIKPLDEVIRLLGELREAWMEIDPEKTKLGVGAKSTSGTALARQFVYS